MADDTLPDRSSPASRFRHLPVELHVQANRLTAFAFAAGGAVLGADTFGLLMGLWPLYPTAVPVLLVACAVAVGVSRLVRLGDRGPAGLTWRPPRRGAHRLPR